jgi:hypothetical protein
MIDEDLLVVTIFFNTNISQFDFIERNIIPPLIPLQLVRNFVSSLNFVFNSSIFLSIENKEKQLSKIIRRRTEFSKYQ